MAEGKTYTREQLITAMRKFNKDALAEPDNFEGFDDSLECAVNQVDNLIARIE